MDQLTLELDSGSRARENTIVRMAVDEAVAGLAGDLSIEAPGGLRIPAQIDEDENELVFQMASLPAGTSQCVLQAGGEQAITAPEVKLHAQAVSDETGIDIRIDGEPLTRYNFPSEKLLKPFLAPVIGPWGEDLCRAITPEITEHPHQKGIFIAHGSVGGEELWNEPEGLCGRIEQLEASATQGDVFAKVTARLVWKDREGKALMKENRAFWFYVTAPEARLIDLKMEFVPVEGDVVLGATKEAGLLGIRVHPDIATDAGKGGQIENAYGGVGEGECWSKKAQWCDYHGVVGGRRAGIAAFDHPANLRFPTRWHVRAYGLFAANPWFWDGPYTLEQGSTLTFRHRILIHAGDTRTAEVGERYLDWENPVKAARV
jgi:hypothetical protein